MELCLFLYFYEICYSSTLLNVLPIFITYAYIILLDGQNCLVMTKHSLLFLFPKSVMPHQAGEFLHLLLIFICLPFFLASDDILVNIPSTNEEVGADQDQTYPHPYQTYSIELLLEFQHLDPEQS